MEPLDLIHFYCPDPLVILVKISCLFTNENELCRVGGISVTTQKFKDISVDFLLLVRIRFMTLIGKLNSVFMGNLK